MTHRHFLGCTAEYCVDEDGKPQVDEAQNSSAISADSPAYRDGFRDGLLVAAKIAKRKAELWWSRRGHVNTTLDQVDSGQQVSLQIEREIRRAEKRGPQF